VNYALIIMKRLVNRLSSDLFLIK